MTEPRNAPTLRVNALAAELDFLDRAMSLANHAPMADAAREDLFGDLRAVLNAIAEEPPRNRRMVALKTRALLVAHRLEAPEPTPFVTLAVSLARSLVPQ